MTTLQEYDLKIKPPKIVWGQVLCQMTTEEVEDDGWENEATMYELKSVEVVDAYESWYSGLKYYLSIGDSPAGLDAQKCRALHLKSVRYQLVSGISQDATFSNKSASTFK